MAYLLQTRSYCRLFRQPLRTGSGLWTKRRGLLLRLEETVTGRVGFGEVAPLESFGTESHADAARYCASMPDIVSREKIETIPTEYPAVRHGFLSALYSMEPKRSFVPIHRSLPVAGLLPAGTSALSRLPSLLLAGYTVFKWKIGTGRLQDEQEVYRRLVAMAPPQVRFRLDANGALDREGAESWAQLAETLGVEYIEQPLPPAQWDELLAFSRSVSVPVALDESVVTDGDLVRTWEKGWRGIFVIKPALLGDPENFEHFCTVSDARIVISTAFETSIGIQHALRLAFTCQKEDRALGFGALSWLPDDGFCLHDIGIRVDVEETARDLTPVWDRAGLMQ